MSEAPIQAVILGLGWIGLAVLSRRNRVAAAGLAGFAISGLFFGYLAGWIKALDSLQPGRQTYALFAASSMLAGIGLAEIAGSLRALGSRRVGVATLLGMALIGYRLFGPHVLASVRHRVGAVPRVAPRPFLSSEPPPGLETIVRWVKDHVKPGERVFYEEVGLDLPGVDPDPFAGGRYGGLLPQMTGVEVIGGFYLHIGITTNFTQIGEGRLFGEKGWTREQFVKYARIYRPAAMICWNTEARRFCTENPDLVQITLREGRLMAGRVLGFEGSAIRGKAVVSAEPGRLRVSGLVPDLDGLVVLRYHHAPGMRCRPPMRLEPVFLEDDPVPFVGLRPAAGQFDALLDLAFPPGR